MQNLISIGRKILPFNRERELRILVLAGDQELFSRELLETYPNGRLTLAGLSREELNTFADRLEPIGPSRLSRLPIEPDSCQLKGTYDLICSSFLLHRLSQRERARLKEEIYTSLEPGGLYLHCEWMQTNSPLTFKIYQRLLTEKTREAREQGEEFPPMPSPENQLERMDLHRSLLEIAGFTEITVWYQYLAICLCSGAKPLV